MSKLFDISAYSR